MLSPSEEQGSTSAGLELGGWEMQGVQMLKQQRALLCQVLGHEALVICDLRQKGHCFPFVWFIQGKLSEVFVAGPVAQMHS